jgi:hypothetical protein
LADRKKILAPAGGLEVPEVSSGGSPRRPGLRSIWELARSEALAGSATPPYNFLWRASIFDQSMRFMLSHRKDGMIKTEARFEFSFSNVWYTESFRVLATFCRGCFEFCRASLLLL